MTCNSSVGRADDVYFQVNFVHLWHTLTEDHMTTSTISAIHESLNTMYNSNHYVLRNTGCI